MPIRRALVLLSSVAALHTLALTLPSVVTAQAITRSNVPIVGPPPPAAPAMVARDSEGFATMRATRVTQPLQIDGRLDEEPYRTVPGVGDFLQQEPREGQPVTEKTEVWVFFDDDNVYVTGRMWDSHPERIVANEMRRDNVNIFQNDNFGVAFDTFYDRRSGYFFQTNPLGGLRDGLVADQGSINYDWNTVWSVSSRKFEGGWISEMAIPFKSLRYREGQEQIWSINFRRVVRWKNEMSCLTRVPASYSAIGVARFSVAGTLVGIETPKPSMNLELKPYGISDVVTNREAQPAISNRLDGDFGLDGKYGITKSMTFDFTYNTDFAQVEDDDQQVNLTRFSLFFPEKREFFLEGQGIFEFANVRQRNTENTPGFGTSETPIIFFSRRIGLNNARTVPIELGGRLTGRVGKYTIGLLNIQTRDAPLASAVSTNFSVLRVRRDFLRRSNFGMIATNRSPANGLAGSNQVAGVDLNLAFFQSLEMGAYYARTRTPGRNGDDESYRAQFNYNADRYGLQAEHLKVGREFNPEVGFLRREDFVRNYAQARFSPRPKNSKLIRKVRYESNIDRISGNDGVLQSRLWQATFNLNFNSGDIINVDYNRNYEFLDAPFRIATGVTLPVGEYNFQEVAANYTMGPQRRVSGGPSLVRGSFYNGDKTTVGFSGRVELTPQLAIEPRVSVDRVHLLQGDFTNGLVSTRTTFTVTPHMFAGALIQYNSSTNSLSSNVRFRWEYTPGSDLFVVYSEGRDTRFDGFPGLQNRGFVVKLTRLVRF